MSGGPAPSQYHSLLSQALGHTVQNSQPSLDVRHPFPTPQLVSAASTSHHQLDTHHPPVHPIEAKRKPGRPKGSKTVNRKRPFDTTGHVDPSLTVNKKPHFDSQITSSDSPSSSQTHSVPQPKPDAWDRPVDNSAAEEAVRGFYEFQWRVLSLCSEFYDAATDLVRATPAIVLAQSLRLGSQANPLRVLSEAKNTCDLLLANPTSLSANLPPTFTNITLANTQQLSPRAPISTPPDITAQPSFIPPSTTPPYSATPVPLPVRPQSSSQIQTPHLTQSHLQISPQLQVLPQVTGSIESSPFFGKTSLHNRPTFTIRQPSHASHGVWKEDEIAKLQALAEESKTRSENGEIDWDWVVESFGETRTRHQILIKATGLNLKPTSTHPSRARKRRETIDSTSSLAGPSDPPATQTSGSATTSPAIAVPPSQTFRTELAENRRHSLPLNTIFHVPPFQQHQPVPSPSSNLAYLPQPPEHQNPNQQLHPGSSSSSNGRGRDYYLPQRSPDIPSPTLPQHHPHPSPPRPSTSPQGYSVMHHHPGPPYIFTGPHPFALSVPEALPQTQTHEKGKDPQPGAYGMSGYMTTAQFSASGDG